MEAKIDCRKIAAEIKNFYMEKKNQEMLLCLNNPFKIYPIKIMFGGLKRIFFPYEVFECANSAMIEGFWFLSSLKGRNKFPSLSRKEITCFNFIPLNI